MGRRRLASAIWIAGTLLASPFVKAAAPVHTDSGWVEGVEENGVAIFRAIPFAAPPVGELRWREPQPPKAWPEVRKAHRFAPACPQKGSYPVDAPAEARSEDCLYLNVWAPADAKERRLPVMVWIYGGGLQNGSASTPLYAGDRLARRDVIVVAANYRLGVLGFLAHPELTRESARNSSGNYGLMDQLAALEWVKRNIAAFGGDPARVTVFGQSSGAISISALVASPLAEGLFQRAIGQSGGLFEPMDLLADFELAGAEASGLRFMTRAKATNLMALRAMPAEQLLEVPFSTRLILDGHVLSRPPHDVFRDGEQSDVDLLVGMNRDEGEMFIAGRTITVASYEAELARGFPPLLVKLAAPEVGATDAQARAFAAAFNRDMRFGWDMWTWARLAARQGRGTVYVYEFSRAPPAGSALAGMGATHGTEMPYVFDHLDQQVLAWTPEDRALASAMAAYWTNFAKSGDPNGPGLPQWPAFAKSGELGMLLGAEIKVGSPFDVAPLERIDRVYSVARFAYHNVYALLGAAVAILVVALWLLVRGVRRILRRRVTSATLEQQG